jgi:hypothetical protein
MKMQKSLSQYKEKKKFKVKVKGKYKNVSINEMKKELKDKFEEDELNNFSFIMHEFNKKNNPIRTRDYK